MSTIIEQDTQRGQYDMRYETLVVEHPEHGRLLLVQGFGGTDQLRGGAYRWEHGLAVKLQTGDTLASLRAGEWNEATSLLGAVLAGYDDSRPVLEWSGHALRRLAEGAKPGAGATLQ